MRFSNGLTAATLFGLTIVMGGTAQVESTKNGFLVTDDIVKVLAG